MVNDEIDEIDVKLTRVKKLKDSTDLWSVIAVLYYITQNIYFFCLEGWHVKPLSRVILISLCSFHVCENYMENN